MASAVLFCSLTPVAIAQDFKSQLHDFKLETVVEGLEAPWALVKLPDGRLLVTQKNGKLRVIEDGKLLPDSVTGIPEVFNRGQGGLLDIELHPDYAKNGWIYFSYAKPGKNETAATSIFRAKLNGMVLSDVETIFEPPVEDYRKSVNHFGSRLQFDRDNYLFFTVGEGADITTPANQAQKLTTIGGKIHRLHDDGKVPADNPFVNTPGARPSIWTYGNRNPQGLRFEPGTGTLWETEHGPKGGDELNIIKKGANYGWPLTTFGINYDGTPITDKTHIDGMEDSVTHWTPSIAVCGIDFYNGDKFPKWKGNLIVGSLAHTKLIRLEVKDGKVVQEEIIMEKQGRVRDVVCLDDGLIYLVLDSGKIVRLVPAS